MKLHNNIKSILAPYVGFPRITYVSDLQTAQEINEFKDDFPDLCDELDTIDAMTEKNLSETLKFVQATNIRVIPEPVWFEDNSIEYKAAQNLVDTMQSIHGSLRFK